MTMPLEGIRVVELALALFGPRASAHLAEYGAEVIKVEHPQGGDFIRGNLGGGDLCHISPVAKYHFMFDVLNRNKRSITLDLTKEKAREIMYKLVDQADIFLSNFQVTVLEKLGLGYKALSARNSGLIYAVGSGWGLRGPDKDTPAFDYTVWAKSGYMYTMGEPGTPPVSCRPGVGDHICALILDFGIMMALHHRQKTGKGQIVHASLLGALIDNSALSVQGHLTTGEDIQKVSRKDQWNPLWSYFITKDGQALQFAMAQSDRYWAEFCKLLSLEQIQNDPRYATHMERHKRSREVHDLIEAVITQKTMEQWEQILNGSGLIYAFAIPYKEVCKDPQLYTNQMVVDYNHPEVGPLKVVGVPVELSDTPGKYLHHAPELGQHTEDVLLELGYSWEDIVAFKDAAVT